MSILVVGSERFNSTLMNFLKILFCSKLSLNKFIESFIASEDFAKKINTVLTRSLPRVFPNMQNFASKKTEIFNFLKAFRRSRHVF